MSKVLTCPIPENINPLNPNGFRFSIEKIPEVSYFCQEANLPNIDLQPIDIGTPFVNYPVSGDKPTFGDLTIQFLVDSEMSNYKAIFDWMKGVGFPEDHSQFDGIENKFTNDGKKEYSDASLFILGKGHTPVIGIKFIDVMPISLSSLTFSSTASDVIYVVGSATFRYSYYQFD